MPSNPLTQEEINDYTINRILNPPGYTGLSPYMPQGYFLSTPSSGDGPALWRLFDASFISSGTISPDRLGSGSVGLGNLYLADDGTWKAISIPATPTLHQVTTAGNVTTNAITVGNVGVGITPTTTLQVLRGTAGLMAKNQYETAAFEYSGDNKIGVYSSASTIGSVGVSLLLGMSNYTISSLYPGFEFQYVPNATLANNVVKYNFVGRNASGVVTSYAIDLFNIYQDGRVVINGSGSGYSPNSKLLIGTSTDAGYKLDVNGTIAARQDITIFSERYLRQEGVTAKFSSQLGIFQFDRWQSGPVTAMYINGWGNYTYLNTALNLGTNSTTVESMLSVYGSRTASSAIARGVYFNNTLVAAANNDVLVGLDINPTFTNGAFTGVQNVALRTNTTTANAGTVWYYFINNNNGNSRSIFVVDNAANGLSGGSIALRSYGTSFSETLNGVNLTGGASMIVNANAYNAPGLFLNNGNGTNSFLAFAVRAGEGFRLHSSQNIGVGTTTDAGYKLDVNGTARFVSTTAAAAITATGASGLASAVGISGSAYQYGIFGTSTSNTGAGVYGTVGATGGVGVYGNSLTFVNGVGVFGYGTNVGGGIALKGQNGKYVLYLTHNQASETGSAILYAESTYSLNNSPVAVFSTASSTADIIRGIGNSTTVFTVKSSGNVLINTTTDAGQRLQVLGDSRFFSSVDTYHTIESTATGSAGTIYKNTYRQYFTGTNYATANSWEVYDLTASAAVIHVSGVSRAVGINKINASYQLDVAGDIRSTLGANFATTSGLVGIGTTSPGYKLDVNGSFRAADGVAMATASGSVGIGTTSPNYILDVYQTNVKAQIRSSGENQNATLFLGTPFGGTSSPKVAIIARAKTSWSRADLAFCLSDNQSSNSVEATISDLRMVILSDGKVGVNVANPTYQFQVSGDIALSGNLVPTAGSQTLGTFTNRFGDVWAGGLIVGSTFYGDNHQSASGTLYFKDGGGVEKMRMTSVGNFLIGTTTDTGEKLQVNGTVRASAFAIGPTAGWTGTINIPTNPPGQQNIDVQGGIITNVT